MCSKRSLKRNAVKLTWKTISCYFLKVKPLVKAMCVLAFTKYVLHVIVITEKLTNTLKMKAFHNIRSTEY